MGTLYWPAPELERLARPIIDQHHPHLRNVRIDWFWRDKAGRSNGALRAGYAKRISGLAALMGTPGAQDSEDLDYFVIVVAEDLWLMSSEAAHKALVDHELSHCVVEMNDEGEVRLSLRTHDLEEFSAVLRRHGAWRPDIEHFLSQVDLEQLEAFPDPVRAGVDADGVIASDF